MKRPRDLLNYIKPREAIMHWKDMTGLRLDTRYGGSRSYRVRTDFTVTEIYFPEPALYLELYLRDGKYLAVLSTTKEQLSAELVEIEKFAHKIGLL